jgi:hypothetical protein
MSDDLIVIVPTRGRPGNAVELIRAFEKTRTKAKAVFVIDEDDPYVEAYLHALSRRPNVIVEMVHAPSTMVKALNTSAVGRANSIDPPFAIAFMGDDHRPRTEGWDRAYVEALKNLGTGIVYGNDLLQGEALPTQVAMTSDIIRKLGYMAPPSLHHLYVDNFWLRLGHEIGWRYMPDVIVEHVHPGAKKAEWDEGYERVNADEMWSHDKKAFRTYMRTGFAPDAAKLKSMIRSKR